MICSIVKMICRFGVCFSLLWLVVTTRSDAATHPCNRECIKGAKPMTCEYNFTIEWYLILSKACYDCPFNKTDCFRPDCVSADGHMRPLITVNRQLPGPAIEVCENDRIIVWVLNHLDDGEATSVHWHGVHQVGTPYMDGLALVTQCPIGLKERFKYDFIASPAGSHWYHSHTGIQLADGLHGAFIIRQPIEVDPNSNQYDYDLSEHVIVVTDWTTSFDTMMSQYLFLMHDLYDAKQMSGLINGKRRHYNVSTRNIIKSNLTYAQTPMEVFKVEKDKRYRLRFIGAMANCPFMIAFDSHQLMVIATDGAPVVPRMVDSFMMHPGERYDFVLTADQPVGNYWLKVLGIGDCYQQKVSVNAILRYVGAPEEDPPGDGTYKHKSGTMLNPTILDWPKNIGRPEYGFNHTLLRPHQLRHAGALTNYTDEKVDIKLYLGMDYLNNDNTIFNNKQYYPAPDLPNRKAHFTPTLDNITFKLPPVPPLSQPDDLDESWYCNRSTIADPDSCLTNLCHCIHMLHFPLNAIVEIVMFNTGTPFPEIGHPMHTHGYNYRILGGGKVAEILTRAQVIEMDKQGKLERNYINPPRKDTLLIADGGYAIIRFKADNPGLWFLHCHTDSHLMQGKALLFKIGEYSDFPPVPDPFPTCGGFGYSNARKRNNVKQYPGSVAVSSAVTTLIVALLALGFVLKY